MVSLSNHEVVPPLVLVVPRRYSTPMAKDEPPEPKRRNRTMNIADVLSGALDPVLKNRSELLKTETSAGGDKSSETIQMPPLVPMNPN